MIKVQKLFQFLMILIGILGLFSACSAQDMVAPQATTAVPTPSSVPDPTASPTLIPVPTDTPYIPTVTNSPTATTEPQTVLAFTGVIVPARCVQAEIDQRGNADYIYDEVRDILAGADITIGTYNAVMSDQVEMVGCENSWELVGSPVNADSLQQAGFDVMSVATNHIMDCGKKSCGTTAFFDTLYHLQRVGIQTVGAGKNLSQAKKHVVVEVNGLRFGFVSLGEVNERVFADAATPGIAVLTLANLTSAIQQAQEDADIVIVLPHTGPEDYPEVTAQQKFWARNAVAAGADLVVITHTHVVQGYELMEDVPVFYSLGNFVFDQIWARDHQQGVILLVTFENKTITKYEFIATVVDQDGTVHLAIGEEKDQILSRIESLSQDLEQKK